jgi:signal transduction histidine kinase
MKKQNSLIYHVIVFIFAQLAWFSLLSLWIYWYVSNYILLTELDENISAQISLEKTHIGVLVGGLILLIAISVGMSLIFIYLTRQMNLTRLYDNFIANVTHELKSPLSSIQLYLETMQKRDVPQKRQHEFLKTMLQDARRLDTLITSILDVSGIEQKKLAYNFEVKRADSTIKTLIREAAHAFKLAKKSLVVEGQLAGEIVLDQRAVKIVINNLFDNTIKYSRGPARISIRLSNTAKYFVIEFADQGIGINKKDLNIIFNKFQRVYSPDSPNVKGSGLGLYWVRELIRAHGGRISVSSAGIEKGTCFKIEFPIYLTSKKRFTNRLLKFAKVKNNRNDHGNE